MNIIKPPDIYQNDAKAHKGGHANGREHASAAERLEQSAGILIRLTLRANSRGS
jgi:hypothetical protein